MCVVEHSNCINKAQTDVRYGSATPFSQTYHTHRKDFS